MSFWREDLGLLAPDQGDSLTLEATAAGWDTRHAYSLANMSALVYEPEADVRKFLSQRGWQTVAHHNVRTLPFLKIWSNTCWFAARKDGDLLIAFRGTEPPNLLNWLTNLAVAPVQSAGIIPGAPGRVHQGFAAAFSTIWPELKSLLQSQESEGAVRLWITGHSLGGALAFLAAAGVAGAGPAFRTLRVERLYTYGQPRTGDGVFSDWVTAQTMDRCFRVVHGRDIVPWVPPEFLAPEIVRAASGALGRLLGTAASAQGYAHGGQLKFVPAFEGPLSDSIAADATLSLANILARMGPAVKKLPGLAINSPGALALLPPEILHHFPRGSTEEQTSYVSRLRDLILP